MRTILVFALGILFFPHYSFGQTAAAPATGTISGQVADEQAKPAGYISVSVLRAQDSTAIKGTLSDEAGAYSLANIPYGTYLVSISSLGYKATFSAPFAVSAAQPQAVVPALQLQAGAFQLKEVKIIGARPLIERKIDRTIMNVENSALATGNNALDILQRAPGVTLDREDKVNLRGKSGVQVLIDGKPTHLSQDQLATLLRTTEGENIQAIEIITNPSSRFEAAGNAGVINIRLKKNKSFGTNGSVSASAGHGRYHKASTSLSLNHRTAQWNLFGNASYTNSKNFHSLDINRFSQGSGEGSSLYTRQQSRSTRPYQSRSFRLGADYALNPRHTLGVLVTGNLFTDRAPATGLTRLGSQPSLTDSSVVATNLGTNRFANVAYNLNYKAILDSAGQELTADLDYSRPTGDGQTLYNNEYFNSENTYQRAPYIFRNSSPFSVDILSFKLDYTYPINKTTKLETGLKNSRVETDNTFLFDELQGENFTNVANRSNHFIYSERIAAAYLNVSKQFAKTSVQAGLRAEQTNSNGNSVSENKVVDRQYLNLFPTLFINQVIGKNHDLGFSYSRRIDRPDYSSLNPFVTFIDQYLYSEGNPFLKPQYTNSFELLYTFQKTYSATLGYSRTTDFITQVLLPAPNTKGLYQTMANLAEQDAYNLNLNAPLTVNKWWSASNNLTLFYNRFSTPNLLGKPFTSGRVSGMLSSSHSFTLNSALTAELTTTIQTPAVYGTIEVKSIYGVDLGVKKTFADKKATLKLAVTDVLNSRGQVRLRSTIPGVDYTMLEQYDSRVARLSFSYRFGNAKVKAARSRTGGADAEKNRVKGGL